MCTLRVKMQSSIYSVALLTPTGTERNKREKKIQAGGSSTADENINGLL